MNSEERHRQELNLLPNETLEAIVEMRFVWLDSVSREERDQFYERQLLAEEVLAERRGAPLPTRAEYEGSIWSKPKAPF